jgi:hypothetical protein
MRRVALLRGAMRAKAVSYSWHEAETGHIEAALSRGDRRLGAVLERAVRDGGRLDAWGEYFSYDRWLRAFAACGLDPAFYAARERATDEILPWSHISSGVTDEFLLRERALARAGAVTPDCRRQCSDCGARALGEEGVCHA